MNRPPSFDGENGNKGNGFAQIGASTETGATHSCHFTAQRNKEAVDDFFGLYSGSSQYTDDDFTPGHDSLFWADRDEEESEWEKRVEWKRANEVFTNHSLFGSRASLPKTFVRASLATAGSSSAPPHLQREPTDWRECSSTARTR